MARAVISNTNIAESSGDLITTTEFTVDGIAVANNGKRIVIVRNTSGGSINVIEKTNSTVEGLTVPDRTTAVAAGAARRFGPWSDVFVQDDGTVYIDVSAFADVDYEVLEVTPR